VKNANTGRLQAPLPSGRSAVTSYAFGDTDLARARLGLVADTFAEPTRELLRTVPAGDRRYLLDLGCGPGYSALLLRERFPHAFVTGIDASEAMVAEARERLPDGLFFVGDVTAPLRLPAHLVYARLLLGHVADTSGTLANWSRALLPNGILVCEEPIRYRSDVPVFARYETVVTDVVASYGGTLWAGAALDPELPQCSRDLDRVVQHPVSAGRAAGMFWRNAATFGGDHEMIEELRTIERDDVDGVVVWELRQTVWVKNPV
jgi:SAM-dependent methyltransferase